MAIERADSLLDTAAIQAEFDRVEAMLGKLQKSLVSLLNLTKENKGAGMAEFSNVAEKLSISVDEVTDSTKDMKQATVEYTKVVKEAATGTAQLGSGFEALSGDLDDTIIKQLKTKMAIEALTKGQKMLGKEMQLTGGVTTEYFAKIAALEKETQILKAQSAELTRTIRLQTKENVSASGSVDELKSKYDKLYQAWRGLDEAQRNSDVGKELNAELSLMSDHLNELQKSAGNFSGNVGRYAGSLAKPFESLQLILNQIQADLKNGIGIGGTDEAALKRSKDAIDAINQTITKGSKETATSTSQVMALAKGWTTVTQIVSQGGNSSLTSSVKDLGKEIGQAKDEVQDLQDELKLNASDTKGIDNVVGSLNALAGIAQGAASAYALFGASEEDAAKVTAKLMAVQGIANSIQQVGQELTKRGTIANKAYMFVQGLVTTATNGTAAATARLNAVLKLSTIGLVVAAIGGLAYLLSKAGDASAGLSSKQKHLNSIMEESKDAFVKATQEVQNVKTAFEQARTGVISKEEAVQVYNETIGQTIGQVKSLDEAEKMTAKNAQAYIQFTMLKAQAQIALGKAAEEAFNAEVIANQRRQQAIKNKYDPNAKQPGGMAMAGNLAQMVDQNLEKGIKGAKEKTQTFMEIFEDLNKKIAVMAKENKFDVIPDKDKGKEKGKDKTTEKDKPQKVKDNTAEDLLKSAYSINKRRLQLQIDTNKEIVDNDKLAFQQRLDALVDYNMQQMQMIELDKAFLVEVEKAKVAEIIKGLEEQKKVKGANVQEINQVIENEERASANRILDIQEEATDKLIRLGREYLAAQKGIIKAGEDAKADVLSKILDNANEEIKVKEKQLDTISSMEEADQAKRLEREKEFNQRRRDMNKQLFEEVKAAIIAFVGFSFDKRKNQIQEEMDLREQQTEKELDAVNKSGETEEKKAARVQVIQARAAAQKAVLEQKQRKVDQDKARFEKGVSALNIIINTAVAISKAVAASPLTGGMPWVAYIGAMGALQLATVLAQPIPKYRGGRGKHKDEFAIVGDGGVPEYIKRGSTGLIEKTPAKDTLVHLMADDVVLKDKHALQKELAMGQPALSNYVVDRAGNINMDRVVDAMAEVRDAVGGIKVQSTVITKRGWREQNRRLADYDKWVKSIME